MKTGLVIFARFDSRRLPGKALLPIGSRPMLGHVLDRARRVGGDTEIVVATTSRTEDEPIVGFCAQENVSVFRGSLDDVLKRAVDCADAFGFPAIARICGDRPFFDPIIVRELADRVAGGGVDLATTMYPKSYPPGLTAEVVTTPALRDAQRLTADPDDREHATAYFYRCAGSFRIWNAPPPAGLDVSGVSLVVDDERDLERARFIAARSGPDCAAAPVSETIRLAKQWDGEFLSEQTT